jgi:hypothetical protein
MAKEKSDLLTAFCMKTKEKNVVIQDAVIDVTNNRYIAKGNDGKGNKIVTILGKEKALAHVAAGRAAKGAGW